MCSGTQFTREYAPRNTPTSASPSSCILLGAWASTLKIRLQDRRIIPFLVLGFRDKKHRDMPYRQDFPVIDAFIPETEYEERDNSGSNSGYSQSGLPWGPLGTRRNTRSASSGLQGRAVYERTMSCTLEPKEPS